MGRGDIVRLLAVEGGCGERFEFRILGPFEVTAGGTTLDIGSPKQRTVLGMLVLRLNEVVSADALIDELWGTAPPESAVPTLQSLVSRLRRTLSEAETGVATVSLRTREPGYVLAGSPDQVDARRFERLVARARQDLARGEAAGAAVALGDALALWRGDALADLSDQGFARAEAARLDELRLTATEALAEAELSLGRPVDAYARLESLIAAHPLRERAWGHLIVALYRLGRQADALRAYQRIRRMLAEELGVEPTPWLQTVESQILHHQSELDWPAHAHPDRAAEELRPRGNLPIALTPFVGRTDELGELVDLLSSARLLTLTGVGGAGKTRLATELAGRLADRFPDGVWMVKLAPLHDPSLLISEVTAALGVESAGAGEQGGSAEWLSQRLRGRRLLLCLDNCEHLIEAAADLVHTLLCRCPTLSILTTSREVLGVAGEVVWGVPPLSLPSPQASEPGDLAASDAVALFCARASRAGLELNAGNAATVAQICRRLDGVPLALELAAARVRLLGVHQLAARLDDRFRVLTGGPRTAMPRHQTLRAAMDWSHRLLPEAERVVFRRLAAFPDSFDLTAAEAIAGKPGSPRTPVLEVLARLVDKSLVSLSGDGEEVRYRLLETVRHYAAEKLAEAGESVEVHRRHRDYFLAVASQYGGERAWQAGVWANRLAADYANFRAALEYSLAEPDADKAVRIAGPLWTFWMWSGRAEGQEWLARSLDLGIPEATSARVEGLVGLAALMTVSGADAPQPCSDVLDEALALAARLEDPNAIARARFIRAEFERSRGDLVAARREYTAALEWCTEAGIAVGRGWCHNNLGWVDLADGHVDRARSHFEQALEPTDEVLRAHSLAALAPLQASMGESAAALSTASLAVEAARDCSPPGVLVMALVRAIEAGLLLESADRVRVGVWLRELLGRLRDLGSRRWAADALELAAVFCELDGDAERAARLHGAGQRLRSEFGERPGGARAIAGVVEASRVRVAAVLGTGFDAAFEGGRQARLEDVLGNALP